MSALLTVSEIVTAYGKIEALKGVSLTVKEGGVTVPIYRKGLEKLGLIPTEEAVLTSPEAAADIPATLGGQFPLLGHPQWP